MALPLRWKCQSRGPRRKTHVPTWNFPEKTNTENTEKAEKKNKTTLKKKCASPFMRNEFRRCLERRMGAMKVPGPTAEFSLPKVATGSPKFQVLAWQDPSITSTYTAHIAHMSIRFCHPPQPEKTIKGDGHTVVVEHPWLLAKYDRSRNAQKNPSNPLSWSGHLWINILKCQSLGWKIKMPHSSCIGSLWPLKPNMRFCHHLGCDSGHPLKSIQDTWENRYPEQWAFEGPRQHRQMGHLPP